MIVVDVGVALSYSPVIFYVQFDSKEVLVLYSQGPNCSSDPVIALLLMRDSPVLR